MSERRDVPTSTAKPKATPRIEVNADNFRAFIQAQGWTKEQAARNLGISPATLYRALTPFHSFTPDNQRMASLLSAIRRSTGRTLAEIVTEFLVLVEDEDADELAAAS